MSYENVPKNLTEKAVLTRGGRPDYITLSSDPAPIPTADEAGAIWEHSDTGDRFRWTSTVWVQIDSGDTPVTSTLNSTTNLLGIGATFTGVWELSPRSMALVQSYSDAPGTLYFEFSADGVNADSIFPVNGTEAKANLPLVQPAAVGGRFFRVRYVNGAVAQTEFRLIVTYNSVSNFYSPLNQPYDLQSPSTLHRTTWTWLDTARGLTSGLTSIKKFGRNNNVGTSFTPVAIGGVYQTPQSGAATALRIKAGGDANDTAAGSGAREVTLLGLDENFNYVTETLATAGSSASSPTSATFTRLFRAYVSESGSYASVSVGSHAADIVIENSAGGTDWGIIDATDFPKSQSEIGAYSIPAGSSGYVKLRDLSIDSGKTIDLVFFVRSNIDETSAPYSAMRAQSVVSGVSGGSIETFGSVDVPFGPYIGPTDIGFMAKVAAGSAKVSVEFEIFILEE